MAGLQRNSSRGGWPSPAEEELTDIMRLEDWLVERKEATYLLTMKGDSMKDAGILDGDVVVVERGPSPRQRQSSR
jgi:DNA polymerase V